MQITQPLRPAVDAVCSARYHPSGVPTIFRLRAWPDERIAVVTDDAANRGMSVTNAVEQVATVTEAVLDVRFYEADPAAWAGWQLAQRVAATGRIDLVRFGGRDDDALCDPEWVPLPPAAFAWLYSAVG